MRWQVGEVSESLVSLRKDARGQLGQLDRSQGGGLHTRRIDEHRAGFGQGEVGSDRLLVEHLDTRLTADGRQAVERPGEGLPRLQDGRQDGPRRTVDNVQRGGGLRVRHACEGSRSSASGSQVRHDAADRDRGTAGPREALDGLVVKPHTEAVGIRGSLGQERRTAGKGHRLSIHGLAGDGQGGLCHLGTTGLDRQREGRGAGVAIGQPQPNVDDLQIVGPSVHHRSAIRRTSQEDPAGIGIGHHPVGQRDSGDRLDHQAFRPPGGMNVVLEGTAGDGRRLRKRFEGLASRVVPTRSEIGLLMQPAVHPERILTVPDTEGLVMAERAVGIPRFRPVDRKVALPSRRTNLQIVVHPGHALTFHRWGQQRQGHGRLQDTAGLDHVVEEEAGLGLLPENLEDGHAGPPIRTHVVDEHEG